MSFMQSRQALILLNTCLTYFYTPRMADNSGLTLQGSVNTTRITKTNCAHLYNCAERNMCPVNSAVVKH